MIKTVKRVSLIVMSLALTLMLSNMAFADERTEAVNVDRPYVIINGTHIVYEGENFESPETGEYFRWDNSRGIDKFFSFKIRYSVQSSNFRVNSSKVLIASDAHIENSSGRKLYGYNGHSYTVSIGGWYSRDLKFAVGGNEAGTVSGLTKGGQYRVSIYNSDSLGEDKYLVGEGTVSTVED